MTAAFCQMPAADCKRQRGRLRQTAADCVYSMHTVSHQTKVHRSVSTVHRDEESIPEDIGVELRLCVKHLFCADLRAAFRDALNVHLCNVNL